MTETKIRLTNPNSYTQVAMYAFGTYEAVARATNSKPSTVRQWRTRDKIPNRHLLTLAARANLDPIVLYRYCQDKTFTEARIKSAGVVDALLNTEPHPDLDDTRRKQLLTLWGDRLPLLKQIFETLTGDFKDKIVYGKAVAAASKLLGVSPKHVYRLMRQFGVARKPFTALQARRMLSKSTKEHAKACGDAAISAIKGQKYVAGLAKDLKISGRQLFRYVSDALANHPGVTLSVLTRYPGFFRMAVANEIERKDHSGMALKLKAIYDEYPPQRSYRAPRDLKRANYKDKLIAVLGAEVSVNELSTLADVPVHTLEESFNRYCVPFGLSWQALRGQSLYHQAFFAEILKGSGRGP